MNFTALFKISLFYLVFELSSICILVDSKEIMCPSLSPPEGVQIKCSSNPVVGKELKEEKNATDSGIIEHDCSEGSLPKTTAQFSCKQFYTSSNPEDLGGRIKCNKKGKWRNLKRFRKYSCRLPTRGWIEKLVNENKIVIFGKSYCGYCTKTKELFKQLNEPYYVVEIDYLDETRELLAKEMLYEMTGMRTWPNVFVNKVHVGGFDRTFYAYYDGTLQKLLSS